MFRDRLDAGLLLAAKLKKYKHTDAIVLAVPRGGVPVAYAIAWELNLPMDLVLAKKIGHPGNKEYAIGAASLTDFVVVPHEQVPDQYIREELVRVRARLLDMHKKYVGDHEQARLENRTVILVDDGIATGNTLTATVHLLRRSRPGKIVIAVPVASASAVKKLAIEVDEIITVHTPDVFYGVGVFYEDFEQVTDEEVLFYLDKIRKQKSA